MEVDRRFQDGSGFVAELAQLEQTSRRSHTGGCQGDSCDCLVPMWKPDDSVCVEPGSFTWTDDAGVRRSKTKHQELCTVKCPLEKWWYQAPSVEIMECFGGVWWQREESLEPEEVVQLTCRTSAVTYCLFLLTVIVLIFVCVRHVTGRQAHKAAETHRAAGEQPAAEAGHKDSAPPSGTSAPPPAAPTTAAAASASSTH